MSGPGASGDPPTRIERESDDPSASGSSFEDPGRSLAPAAPPARPVGHQAAGEIASLFAVLRDERDGERRRRAAATLARLWTPPLASGLVGEAEALYRAERDPHVMLDLKVILSRFRAAEVVPSASHGPGGAHLALGPHELAVIRRSLGLGEEATPAGEPPLDELFERRYTFDGVLGSGACGVVLRARRRPDGAPVAIKLFAARGGPGTKIERRFEREFALLAELDHPHIVKVQEYGRLGGTPYFVMDYVAGENLGRRFEREAPHRAEALRILEQVAGALDAIHGRGIVHRDLKPGNVLLDPRGNAVLVDFGIARDEREPPLTASQAKLGTCGWMAPEQEKDPHLATAASDLWSFGRLAGFLLGDPEPLPAVLEECLAEDPAARPPSAAAVVRRLRDELAAAGGAA